MTTVNSKTARHKDKDNKRMGRRQRERSPTIMNQQPPCAYHRWVLWSGFVLFLLSQLVLLNLLESIEDDTTTTSTDTNAAATSRMMMIRASHHDNSSSSFSSSSSSFQATAATRRKMQSQRSLFEQQFPPSDTQRIQQRIQSLRVPSPSTYLSAATTEDVNLNHSYYYDILNCPDSPPLPHYPLQWKLVDEIFHDWSMDHTDDIPARIYQSICVFDWHSDYDKALRYRNAEVPFVLQNHPELLLASERWNFPNYVRDLIGPHHAVRTEYSPHSNVLMFTRNTTTEHNHDSSDSSDADALIDINMTYTDFVKEAERLAALPMDERPSHAHWYMRLIASSKVDDPHRFLYDELPMFRTSSSSTSASSSFFMVRPEQERGIHCRIGMVGNVAALHFDPMRNFVVSLGGIGPRRYILAQPNQCLHAQLFPPLHRHARHSRMMKNLSSSSVPVLPPPTHPFRAYMRASEVVLQTGDALYIPDSWLHMVVSLNSPPQQHQPPTRTTPTLASPPPVSYQCNIRSGLDENPNLARIIRECGFAQFAFPETARIFPHVYTNVIQALDHPTKTKKKNHDEKEEEYDDDDDTKTDDNDYEKDEEENKDSNDKQNEQRLIRRRQTSPK